MARKKTRPFTLIEGGSGAAAGRVPDGATEQDAFFQQMIEHLAPELTLMLMVIGTHADPRTGEPLLATTFDPAMIRALEREGLVVREAARGKGNVACRLTQAGFDRAVDLLRSHGMVSMLRDADEQAVRAEDESRRGGGEPQRAFVFRVDLELSAGRSCWREIVVPSNLTFEGLHEAIQASFLWLGYHLFEFTFRSHGANRYVAPQDSDAVDALFSPDHDAIDPRDLYLDEVFPRTRVAHYVYDYGDNWRHKLRFVREIADYAGPWPACTAGEGDAPPEDVGGAGGFEDFLEVMADKDHPEHESAAAWARAQLFEPFSLEAVNERMRIWHTQELLDRWDAVNGRAR